MSSSKSFSAKVELDENKIQLENSIIAIQNGSFSVEIIVGDKAFEIKPEGTSVISKIDRKTPIGDGIQTKYRWNTHNGFEFSYIITSIGAEIVGVRQWVVKTSIPEKVQSYKYT